MLIFSKMAFLAIKWAARRGLCDGAIEDVSASTRKHRARQTGLRGETYAYWYLRRLGYVFIARNYMPGRAKGEIDLIGYDGKTLVFIEVRTRTLPNVSTKQSICKELTALPELSITPEKQEVLARTAKQFLAERHVQDAACRFDVVAIDNQLGGQPIVRLHKAAFSPQM